MSTTRDTLADLATKHADLMPGVADALANPKPSGTMKAWMAAHDDSKVTTVQVARLGGVWAPTGRTVKTHPTFATFDESRRYFAGCKVIHADARLLIIDEDGDTIAYLIES